MVWCNNIILLTWTDSGSQFQRSLVINASTARRLIHIKEEEVAPRTQGHLCKMCYTLSGRDHFSRRSRGDTTGSVYPCILFSSSRIITSHLTRHPCCRCASGSYFSQIRCVACQLVVTDHSVRCKMQKWHQAVLRPLSAFQSLSVG